MIVDTSAIMAILLDEPEQRAFVAALSTADRCIMSAGAWVELAAVIAHAREPALEARLAIIIEKARVTIEPVSVSQARLGHAAYLKFCRDSGQRTRLNFGDCFAYALAKETGEPLLFKGDDFTHTDIESAL